MSDEYRPKVDLVKAAILGLAKDEQDFEITVRPGLTIEGSRGSDSVIKYDGHTCALEDIPAEIEHEILTRVKEHREQVANLQQIKFLNPSLNPMIKVDED